MQKLPVGIQTFSKIREGGYLYIDKTDLALDLITNYQYSFLSRPRRFGKSLFLDTLHNIFEGKKEYFKDLAIYDKWNFEDVYPVIKIDWAGDFKTLESTHQVAIQTLQENQDRLGLQCDFNDNPSGCFRELIHKAKEKYNKPVVILVDEYDKPILDNLDNTERALENRDFLRSFYVMMKANDAYIKFAFLTGISKFSKANIFSGLNNLTDISLKPKYGTICGYTQDDIETTFLPYLEGVDLERVKEWYNGYNFLGDKVYNPFDILQFLTNDCLFKNYWWESGNPYYLITLLKQKNYNIPELENLTIGDELLNSFEVDKIKLEVLLFQAGYLTIKEQIQKRNRIEYSLKVPNLEVQISLNILFIDYLTDTIDYKTQDNLYDALEVADIATFKETFEALFASIPYNNYVGNKIEEYEGYYASVFYAYLAATGFNIVAEDVTNQGRIDLTLLVEDNIYIIEFKVGSDDALKQIEQKNYAQKYQNQNKAIYLIGINFSKESRNIEKFEYKKV